jgi:hypothetical protein
MKKILLFTLSLALVTLAPMQADAQFGKKKKKQQEAAKLAAAQAASAPKPGAIEDLDKKVKSLKKVEGLFTMYLDTATGNAFMLVKENQINKQFIYFTYTENGPLSTGHNRGIFRETKVFEINKYFGKIEFNTINNSFYFDSSSALYKSRNANIVPAMMASEKIVAQNKDKNQFLISADNIFLKETLHQIKPSMNPMAAALGMFNLGNLNPSKTRYDNIKNYPKNTDIIVKYVYDDPNPRGGGGGFVTDSRYVEVLLQHSIIEMPEAGFVPRRDDQRLGYFMTQSNDMTSFEAINFRDFIHRWRLEKKDPSLALSEPVKPITWWIENTTPVEYRETIKKALLAWNIAFEKAGFKNAIAVEIQPDTATWDAGDIRYNVIRWTSSPAPPFGGYGPSFVNPITGEILGADIMLEFVFLSGRMQKDKLFDLDAALNSELYKELFLKDISKEDLNQCSENHSHCSIGEKLHQQSLFGMHAMKALGAEKEELSKFVEEALYYLVLHEVGHTLGLMHNMRASQLLSPAELQDRKITEAKGVIGSVMDYPALNFANKKGYKVQQYNTKPGPYDLWVIEYGYSPALEDPIEEEKRLQKILSRSTEKELAFGNDADDMRAPGKGIDPRVNIFDLSNDAITFSSDRMKLIETIFGTITQKYVEEGKSYQELRNAYMSLSGEYGTMADVVSRYIGGVQAERFMAGQKPGSKPLTPTPLAEQKRAMKVLSEQVFAPNALLIPDSIFPYLQPQRRGFGFFSNTEDPKLLDRTLSVQMMPLIHILSASTLKRINNSMLYGNTYSVTNVLNDLNQAIFAADIKSDVNSNRQNLQIFYVSLLDRILNSPLQNSYDNISKARILVAAQDLKKLVMNGVNSGNEDSKNHKKYLIYQLDSLIEKNKK